MLFNSYIFLFAFLPISLMGYFLLGRYGKIRAAALWLTLASLFFYAWWNPIYLILIVISICANYWFGVAIHQAQKGKIPFSPKAMLAISVAMNLGVLGYYKYANFFVDSTNSVWNLHWNVPAVFLPLAISFFTFTQIAYLVDAYHGVTEAYDFLYYALFVSFFPHLIAGPIVSYRRLMPQFAQNTNYRFHATNFAAGLSMFTCGLAKKVIVADNLSALPRLTFDTLPGQLPPDILVAWLGTLAYTFQLYFDFSGYSDMAIGIARMFNIEFPLNFNSPYKAKDIADFWRRWHMTLSQFLRDHIYIPLGGNRFGEPRRYFNLMATMLLGGLWHGAGWNFIIWGGLHGVYLIIHRSWEEATKQLAWTRSWWMEKAGYVLTFLSVVLAWVFFRSHSLGQALSILGTMAHPVPLHTLKIEAVILTGGQEAFGLEKACLLLVVAALISFVGPNTDEIFRLAQRYTSRERHVIVSAPLWRLSSVWALFTGCLLTLAILYMSNPSEFLYFRF